MGASTHRQSVALTDDSPGDADEATLVARAVEDRQAFALLYRRYVDAIYRFCYRRLGSREAAEDATSVVFTKALAALGSYRAGSFRAWLFTIAGHVVVDDVRARRIDCPLDEAAALQDRGPTPEETALAAEACQGLRALLEELSPDQRRVVELRLSGLSGQEIGAVLGRNRAAVDALQYRAVARLRVLCGLPASGAAVEEATDGTRHRSE